MGPDWGICTHVRAHCNHVEFAKGTEIEKHFWASGFS